MSTLPRQTGAVAGNPGAGAGVLADQPAPVFFTMPTPPSTNNLYKNVKGVGRVKTKVYDDFVRMGIADISRQKVRHLAGRVIAILGVERMSDGADIDNRLKAMFDTIVKAGIIEDDSKITAHAITWLPSANGLSWVRLMPVGRIDLSFHPAKDGASGTWIIAPSTEGNEDDFPL